jgi:hypothetical protein
MIANTIFCDASYFREDNTAVLAIIRGKQIWRIFAKAKNSALAEVLAISMARKLCGAGTIISDCTGAIQAVRKPQKSNMIPVEQRARVKQLENLGKVTWQKRRSCKQSRLVDTMSSKTVNPAYRAILEKTGYTIFTV